MGVLDDAIREHLDLKRRRGADPAEIEKAEREALGPVRRDGSALALSDPEAPVGTLPPTGGELGFESDGFADEHPTSIAPVGLPDDVDELPDAHRDTEFEDSGFSDFMGDRPPQKDPLDPPTGQALAAMPPEPAHKPKRRHLFHFRSHDEEPADDFGAGSPLPDELPEDDPFADDFQELTPESLAAPPADPAPQETEPGETVSPAQPIQREESRESVLKPPPLKLTPDAELGHTMEYDVEKAFEEEDKAGDDLLEETPDFLADAPDHDRLWFEQKPPPDFDFDN